MSFKDKKITKTYVWEVNLKPLFATGVFSSVKLLVMCAENIMGAMFQKNVEDAFLVASISEQLPKGLPDSLGEYTVASVRNVGLAVGSVSEESHNLTVIRDKDGDSQIVLDNERLAQLAGLGEKEAQHEQWVEQKEAKAEQSKKLLNEELRKDITNPEILEALADTAWTMHVKGDPGAVDPFEHLKAPVMHVRTDVCPTVVIVDDTSDGDTEPF